MRGLHDHEIPALPEAAWVQRLPWVLRPRLVALAVVLGTGEALLALAEEGALYWLALPVRLLLGLLILVYGWHLLEHSLLGTRQPPRLRWLMDAPGNHAGLPWFLLMIVSGWMTAALLLAEIGPMLAAAALTGLMLLASPWLLLTVVLDESRRRMGLTHGVALMDDLGAPGWVAGVLLAAAVALVFIGLTLAPTGIGVWILLLLAALGLLRLAGLAMHARALFVGVETEEDLALAADAAQTGKRRDRLFQRLYQCQAGGNLAAAAGALDAFLAEEDYVQDQRFLYELENWHWPGLYREHARRVVGRLLAAGKDRAAWALVSELVTSMEFLPASVDDLGQLAETPAGPGERRALLAMVRAADRARQGKAEDPRLARVWLAAAEVAAAEGDTSLARVWLARAETRFPEALTDSGRALRRDQLRQVLASPN